MKKTKSQKKRVSRKPNNPVPGQQLPQGPPLPQLKMKLCFNLLCVIFMHLIVVSFLQD